MDDTAALFRILARSLGVPVESFFQEAITDLQRLRSKEACELLDAFDQIEGYTARRRCIEFVKAEANGSW
ncbi:MAG: hypothetical protein ABW003_22500 [Microvirga sp.]|jgi:hypothetical protein